MAVTNPWFEAVCTVPSGWTVYMEDSAGNANVSLTAGNYVWSAANGNSAPYLSGIAKHWQAQAQAAGRDWTMSIGTDGRLTVTNNSPPPSVVTWGAAGASFRDLCGFTADISAASTTAPNKPEQLWAPDCPPQLEYSEPDANKDDWRGRIEADIRYTSSRAGDVYALAGQRRAVRSFSLPAVSSRYVWINDETLVNDSFERWYRNNVLGEQSWAVPGGFFAFNAGAVTSSTGLILYRAMGGQLWRPMPIAEGFYDRWRCELGNCVCLGTMTE